MKQRPIIITGPTASGKSDFAHRVALATNGAIINCDSVQFYRGIENISASPFAGRGGDMDNIDGVPYRLFSVADLSSHISVTDYLDLARAALDEVIALGRRPIFVGGTGYYINVLLNGISPIPDINIQIRRHAREMVSDDIAGVRRILGENFTQTDPQRTARALEVYLQTGVHLSEWQSRPRTGALIPNALRILISPPRDVLLERLELRTGEMLSHGALDEARNIIAHNYDASRAIGAAQLVALLRGEITRGDAMSDWVVKTAQYAKRQRTWFRTQFSPDVIIARVPTASDIDDVISMLGGANDV